MEKISLYLDQGGSGALYDEMLKRFRDRGVQDSGDLMIFTKQTGTKEGRPCAMLAFTAVIDGRPVLVQTVTTLRALRSALEIITEKHPEPAA